MQIKKHHPPAKSGMLALLLGNILEWGARGVSVGSVSGWDYTRRETVGRAFEIKPLHAPLSLANRFVGVFGMTVQVPVLVLFDTWGHVSLNGTVALELVRDDHPWDIMATLEELPKELRGTISEWLRRSR